MYSALSYLGTVETKEVASSLIKELERAQLPICRLGSGQD